MKLLIVLGILSAGFLLVVAQAPERCGKCYNIINCKIIIYDRCDRYVANDIIIMHLIKILL